MIIKLGSIKILKVPLSSKYHIFALVLYSQYFMLNPPQRQTRLILRHHSTKGIKKNIYKRNSVYLPYERIRMKRANRNI